MAHVQIRPGDDPGTIRALINGEDWSDRIWHDDMELAVVGEVGDPFSWVALRFTLSLRCLREGFVVTPRSPRDLGLVCLVDGVDMSTDMAREFQMVDVDCGEWDEAGLRMAIEVDPLDLGDDYDVLATGYPADAFQKAQSVLASIIAESKVA